MQFASSLSTATDTQEAIDKVCGSARRQLDGEVPDLAMLFTSHHHADGFDRLAEQVCDRIEAECLLGTTGESIVGTGREVEDEPAICLWLARIPGVSITRMHLRFEKTSEGGTIVGWPDQLPESWPENASFLLLAEPFTFPTDYLLQRLNEDQPHIPVAGGMASGATAPGQNRLFIGRRVVDTGAVGALVHGPVRIRTIVSQGCRPIGKHYVVTKAKQNVIEQLGGKPALTRLQEIFATLPTREQSLVQQGVHLGRVVDEYRDHFEQGDFLVRNVMGADTDSGSIAVGDYVRPGQTVQFHIRDRQTADQELHQLLSSHKANESSPQGGLLFTCNGRGTRLFRQAHHDAAVIQAVLGDIPLAGFFAQGELGPVGGKNFVHGFTASIALFEPAAVDGV